MASVNKVHIIGHLGRDPEVRYTASGAAVCNLSIATSRSWKNKDSGEKQEETEWHRVTFFDKLAEIAGEYLKKGSQVYIEGRLKTRKYDKDGVEHYVTEIMAHEMTMLGAKDGGVRPGSLSDGKSRPAAKPYAGSTPRAPATAGAFDDMDDDIPF